MAERVARGEHLHHPDDVTAFADLAERITSRGGGIVRHAADHDDD